MKVFSEIQFEKGVDYSSFQNFWWVCRFILVGNIPTTLLDKCKRTT